MRAVVVGATGFLGLNLVRALLRDGHEVRATRRRRSPTLLLRALAPGETVMADLDDPASLAEALRGVDVAFVASGHYPHGQSFDEEVATARRRAENLARAARAAALPRLVFTSSTGTVAAAPAGPSCEDHVFASLPRASTYAAVKWVQERVLLEAELPVVVLCPAGCLGELDARCGTSALLVAMLRGELEAFVQGTVNLVDADDVARAHLAAASRPCLGQRFILSAASLGLRELLELVAHRYRVAMPALELTPDEARALEPPALSALMIDLVAGAVPVDAGRARRALDFDPVPLVTTLDRAAAWFRTHGFLRKAQAT